MSFLVMVLERFITFDSVFRVGNSCCGVRNVGIHFWQCIILYASNSSHGSCESGSEGESSCGLGECWRACWSLVNASNE